MCIVWVVCVMGVFMLCCWWCDIVCVCVDGVCVYHERVRVLCWFGCWCWVLWLCYVLVLVYGGYVCMVCGVVCVV